jgi:hypothetical protein
MFYIIVLPFIKHFKKSVPRHIRVVTIFKYQS